LLPRPLPIALAAAGVYALLLLATGPVDVARSDDPAVSDGVVAAAVDAPVGVPSTEPSPAAAASPETTDDPVTVATPTPEPPSPETVAEPSGPAPDADVQAPAAPSSSVDEAAGRDVPDTGEGAEPPAGDAPDVVAGTEEPQDRTATQEKTRRAPRDASTEARVGKIRPVAPHRRAGVQSVTRGPRSGGTPAVSAPALGAPAWLADPVIATSIAIPDVVIDEFRIPPFLLPIFEAAGMQYGVPWQVLAAINEIETNYGGNLNVSSAGALGWMQFMPSTWDMYGVDANRDGRKDPSDPVDAIFAAARYLRAAGADTDLRGAVFAYNHADWYVDSVLERAQAIGRLPSDLVDSLAGLARGRFPVGARATYGERGGAERGRAAALRSGGDRRSIQIFARAGAPVIAVDDARVVRLSRSKRLGRFLRLRDVSGNTYTYGDLGQTGVEQGARVRAGAILGRLGRRSGAAPSLRFEIRPAGRGAPRIDPEPILDGWRLLESTAILGSDTESPGIGQIVRMSKAALIRRVLADPRIDIYGCGRSDISSGRIDRRVLATLEFLAASGLAPTVSSLHCGHGYLTASGNVSEHSSGSAVDISAINGISISGHQGAGSITERTIQRLLTLQGAMKPHQIISLMTFAGADNTFAMGDHADHIHVGFRPVEGPSSEDAWRPTPVLDPRQWDRLIDRIGDLEMPVLRRTATD